jgi:ubiquinone/menaquinone biosynthesis C-methylase UbiE
VRLLPIRIAVGLGALKLFDHPGGLSDRVAYRAQQTWLLQFFLALHRRFGILRERSEKDLEPWALNTMWRRYNALLDRDITNVREHLYPRELLFEIPVRNYLRALPLLVKNAPAVMMRRLAKNFMDLPREIELEKYPPYYRRNFHWQTDGYLSRRSAELYDIGVEMLFFGTADIMRRQVIPPVVRFLETAAGTGARPRLLDVGCGTGRTAFQLGRALPRLSIIGVDLSPYYLEVARENCANNPEVSFLEANGEELPFRDEYFDCVTTTFVMHELPRDVRRQVFAEMRRVLKPGGLLVVEDSAQLSESPDLEIFMKHFAGEFHEPYFDEYVGDDLERTFTESGFAVEAVESHFVAKLVSGYKI